MAVEIKVPDMGESVVEATVARWLVNKGDAVKAGDPVVELETDKVDLEVPANRDGVIASIDVDEGQDVEVGDVLGTIDEEAPPAEEDGEPEEEAAAVAPEEHPEEEEPEPEAPEATEEEPPPTPSTVNGDLATPVAKRMAEQEGVDLSKVSGSGVGGRVTKEDVAHHLEQPDQVEKDEQPEQAATRDQLDKPLSTAAQAVFQRPTAEREERTKMSRRRRTIGRRLVEAQQNAAMLTTFNEIDMSAVMDIRSRRRESFEEQHGVRLGFMSFFTRAAVGALKAFPQVNAEIDGDDMIVKHYYDIGIAVGAEEGLVVPVIRDADHLSFADIEREIRELAQKAQDGSLSLSELQGGSFTITNGGVFGSMLSTPILNPPQVGILGLHKIEQRPVVVDGEIVVRPMMYVALTYDHRIVDGREAVQFLVKVKELIEDPEQMLLEA